MMRTLTSIDVWQTLRVLARSLDGKATDKQLRVNPSPRSQHGKMNALLATMGLLELVSGHDDWKKRVWQLSAAGKYAAEYGQYQCERVSGVFLPTLEQPWPKPSTNASSNSSTSTPNTRSRQDSSVQRSTTDRSTLPSTSSRRVSRRAKS